MEKNILNKVGRVLVCLPSKLTEKQIEELNKEFPIAEICHLKDVNKELYSKLNKVTADDELELLAEELYETAGLINTDLNNIYNISAVILPVGTPAFIWAFAKFCYTNNPMPLYNPIGFAHVEKVDVDYCSPNNNITKVQFYKHIKFIWL